MGIKKGASALWYSELGLHQLGSRLTVFIPRWTNTPLHSPAVVVTDNGRHFSAKSVTDWLRQIGSQHVFTAPRHPQSNGLAENFVKTFKSEMIYITKIALNLW